jgi:hypothetical protein
MKLFGYFLVLFACLLLASAQLAMTVAPSQVYSQEQADK